jgi:nucleoid DNA-binding protein
MAIQFSIAKRGLLPHEKEQQNVDEATSLKNLRPQLECPTTVDAVDFQSSSLRLPSVMPKGELQAALSTMQRVLLHELEQGNAVTLPGIGTFRLTLKGDIEVKDGNYHGKDVHVDGINFRPDNEFLKTIRGFKVEQVPFGQAFQTGETEVEACLAELFARQNTITNKDVATAFGQTLTRNRIVVLLGRLVKEGRLIREGKGAQTRYRAAQGSF